MDPQQRLTITGAGSTLQPLDLAIEYLRFSGMRILPLYLLAMAPFSACVFLLIDSVTSQHRSVLPFECLLLTLATGWRWLWLAVAQRRVQADLRGEEPLPVRKRFFSILLTRLVSSFCMTWGGLILFPAFYGFFLSHCATPVLLEKEGKSVKQLTQAIGWIHRAGWQLTKMMLAFSIAILLAIVAVLVLQIFLTGTVLPQLLGVENWDLSLVLSSGAWYLCLAWFLFLVFDLLWMVASVMLFYSLQARRLGSDLRFRLRNLEEEKA